MKYIWRVRPVPTGRFHSFELRKFPYAIYEDGQVAATMLCEDEYIPRDVKIGKHKPITLRVADYSFTPRKWKISGGKFMTIEDAKDAFERILKRHPEIMPRSSGLPKRLSL